MASSGHRADGDEEAKDANGSEEDDDDDDDDDDDVEEHEVEADKKAHKRNSAAARKSPPAVAAASKGQPSKAGGVAPKRRVIQVKTVTPAKKKPVRPAQRSTSASNSGGGGGESARIARALALLSKKVLAPEEQLGAVTPASSPSDDVKGSGISLVAALLASSRPVPGIVSAQPGRGATGREEPETMYTPQLVGIARHWTQRHDPNAVHIDLLNLLFRSVGGSPETNIPPGTDLEELEDADWDDLVTNVVNAMRETEADRTLLCADPPDEAKLGPTAYRKIYKEFWYRLGRVILAHAPSSPADPPASQSSGRKPLEGDEEDGDADNGDGSGSEDESGDSDSEDLQLSFPREGGRRSRGKNNTASKMDKLKEKKKKLPKTRANNGGPSSTPVRERFVSNRFQVELVRDLISRLTELVSVGQPDLRAGGTLAVMQLSKACVERTVELEAKIQVATRQYKAAMQQNSKGKMQALKNAMDAWKRHKAEIEEIVEGPVLQGVFIHRYRDANASIRKECLDALSRLSLIRPDIFLVDKYLKYFGWMASDKKAAVRVAALEGLTAPFRAYDAQMQRQTSSASSATPYVIDISGMQNVTVKFLDRIVDCTEDSQDVKVQEAAMSLILAMLKEEFLDDWQDDDGWEQINLKAFDILSSPNVRRDALYFVLDQLPPFDVEKGTSISEKKQLDQITAIAAW